MLDKRRPLGNPRRMGCQKGGHGGIKQVRRSWPAAMVHETNDRRYVERLQLGETRIVPRPVARVRPSW